MDEPTSPDEILEWSIRLGGDQPGRRIVVAIVGVLAYVIGLLLVHSPLVALVGPLVILGSTTELFFPIWYRLDAEGARSKCGLNVTEIRWENVRRIETSDSGVLVSPVDAQSRLNAFRGVFLRFAGNRGQVLATIAHLNQGHERILGGRPHSGTSGGDDRKSGG